MSESEEKPFYTVKESADYLGVSRIKISKLLKAGVLTAQTNILDSREKLISHKELKKLKTLPRGKIEAKQ